MPLFVLAAEARACAVFSIAGTELHVGLLADEQWLNHGTEARVHHVLPPREYCGTLEPQYVGYLADLSHGEIMNLQTWVESQRLPAELSLHPFADYWLTPHVKEVRDPTTGVLQRKKFSCSGFIQEAYRSIDVTLVDVDELPPVTREHLELIWGAQKLRFALSRYLPRDLSQWHILLPAHLFQAFARHDPRACAHQPLDHLMPSSAVSGASP